MPPPRRLRMGSEDDSAVVYGTPSERDLALDQAHRIGQDFRIMVPWTKVRELGWDPFQAAVRAAQARGLNVQVALQGQDMGRLNRQKLGEYATFVNDATKNLEGVKTWSPWNEPDAQRTGLAPVDYRRLYGIGRRIVKREEGDKARVLIGETSPYNPVGYMNRVLKSRPGRMLAEGYAHHPYQFTENPASAGGMRPGYIGIGRIGILQAALRKWAQQGLLSTTRGGTLPLYATEFGYQTHGSRAMPESTRARWLASANRVARQNHLAQLMNYGISEQPEHVAWDTNIQGAPMKTLARLARRYR